MFLKNLQLNYKPLIHTVIVMTQFSMIANAFSLDLKIDLPPDEGKKPTLYYNPIVKQNRDSTKQNAASLLPPPPSAFTKSQTVAMQNTNNDVASKKKVSREMRDFKSYKKAKIREDNFPLLPCIASNVKFWGRIYTEIDLHEAFLHDKENLSRIYAKLVLPKNNVSRDFLVIRERNKYEAILESLAKKINLPKKWTKDEARVAKLFKKSEFNKKKLLLAKDNIRMQTGLKSQFEEGILRSIKYMPQIFPEIKNSGLPLDLVYMPHVESSYNANAGSKVGAMGLWQIMPGTMRMIAGDVMVAKRTDVKISTRVAMKILKADFDKIQNWPLTLTAYNHGVNGVLRAISETGSKDLCKIIDHYDSPSFKFASSNFYAQFLAARKAAQLRYKSLAKKGVSRLVLQNTFLSNQDRKIR